MVNLSSQQFQMLLEKFEKSEGFRYNAQKVWGLSGKMSLITKVQRCTHIPSATREIIYLVICLLLTLCVRFILVYVHLSPDCISLSMVLTLWSSSHVARSDFPGASGSWSHPNSAQLHNLLQSPDRKRIKVLVYYLTHGIKHLRSWWRFAGYGLHFFLLGSGVPNTQLKTIPQLPLKPGVALWNLDMAEVMCATLGSFLKRKLLVFDFHSFHFFQACMHKSTMWINTTPYALRKSKVTIKN